MERQVFFVSGAYGVGKTTLCNKRSERIKIPTYSASDLISPRVDEQYGAKKSVTDKDKNQQALIHAIEELPLTANRIILSGHFCIFNQTQEVEVLPEYVFTSLGIKKILLLVADSSLILERLHKRDHVKYKLEAINNLLFQESRLANKYADILQCPLYIRKMEFNNNDIDNLADFILSNKTTQ